MKLFEDFSKSNGHLIINGTKMKFKNLESWKKQAEAVGLKIRNSTNPNTGDLDGYWTAKDKNGNFRGEFFE